MKQNLLKHVSMRIIALFHKIVHVYFTPSLGVLGKRKK